MNDGFIYISSLLLQSNHIHFDKRLFEEEFVTHPDFPSVWALTDVLKSLDIILKVIETSWDDLANAFQTPLLAHLHTSNGHFILIKRINKNSLTYIDDTTGKKITESKDSFVEKWDGRIAFIAESAGCNSNKPEISRTIGIISTLTIPLIVLVLIDYYRNINDYFWGLIALKVIGMIISTTLVLHKLGKENFITRRACHLNEHTDCKTVLKSKASKIGNIHMSDIGIVYFSGGLCLLIGSMLWGNCNIVSSMLGCLSLCSLPYILFSIGYQKLVIKKWCMLCIGIMCTLLAEIGWFIGYGFHIPSFSWHQAFIFLSIFTFSTFGWFFLYRIVLQFEQMKKNHLLYLSLKKNHRIFRNLWKEENTCNYPNSYAYIPKDNRIQIDIALSLHCKHCAALFKQIILLADKFSDIYTFQLHFTWSEENIPQHTFMHRLISIHQLQGERKFFTYLQRWYEELNYDILNTKNVPQLIDKDDLTHLLSNNREWYRINHIMQTPTIYVGGKKLPDIYQLEDLRYLSDCFI